MQEEEVTSGNVQSFGVKIVMAEGSFDARPCSTHTGSSERRRRHQNGERKKRRKKRVSFYFPKNRIQKCPFIFLMRRAKKNERGEPE
jgi:hypothetical protein